MKILEILTNKRIIGNIGEKYAADFLKKNKYRILERNFVALGNEIDIICYKDKTFVFVEVKTRTEGKESPRELRPASSVTREKQEKIIRTAAYYRSGVHKEGRMRFDIIEVFLREDKRLSKINHLINTFDKNTTYIRKDGTK